MGRSSAASLFGLDQFQRSVKPTLATEVGYRSSLSSAKKLTAATICRLLFMLWRALALVRTELKAGTPMLRSSAMMEITTNSSTSVKAALSRPHALWSCLAAISSFPSVKPAFSLLASYSPIISPRPDFNTPSSIFEFNSSTKSNSSSGVVKITFFSQGANTPALESEMNPSLVLLA